VLGSDVPLREKCQLSIGHTWCGRALPLAEQAWVSVVREQRMREPDRLLLEWEAPLYNDPRPAAASGQLEGLWEHEVVECFLAAPESGQYVELEFGPHGHWLALEFSGYRRRCRELQVSVYNWQRDGQRWYGNASIELSPLVSRLETGNAYLIHGASPERCYHAAFGDSALAPDFHRIELFGCLWTAGEGR